MRALFQLLPCKLPETAFGLSVSGAEWTVPGIPKQVLPSLPLLPLVGMPGAPSMPGADGEGAGEGNVMSMCRTVCTLLALLGCPDCSRFSVPGTVLKPSATGCLHLHC